MGNTNQSDNSHQYSKKNACSSRPSVAMILSLVVFLAIFIMHILIIARIFSIDQVLLYILFAFNYVFLAAVVYDYIQLLISDPSDPRLKQTFFIQTQTTKDQLIFCNKCKIKVHIYSYHCNKCNRCAEEFDHHCIFLNNCIGSQNYTIFFRILLTLSVFLMINMGEGIWVALQSTGEDRIKAILLGSLSFVLFPQIIILMCFHVYISVFVYKTTLEMIRGDIQPEKLEQIKHYNPQQRKEGPSKIHRDKTVTQTNIIRDHQI